MDKDIFEIDLENINIEDIMKQIRKKIKDNGVVDEEIEFNNNLSEEEMLSEYLKMVNATYNIISDKKITSHRKIIGKILVCIKRAIRKSIHWYTQPIVEQQNEFNAFSTRTLNSMNDKLSNMEKNLNNIDELNDKIKVLEKELLEKNKKLDFDYFSFEEKYRGNQEEIKSRLQVYLKYFKESSNILDIGCGRGEFLEILKENNIEAKGIDIDDDMISVCKNKKLNIEKHDALEYLNDLEDNSLGGVIMNQVIEHMEPNYLIELVELVYKKLKPGAHFIAETINPQSLIVFTEAYFMDLSHVRMIHPYTIKFLLESKGFSETSIKYLSKVGDDLKLPEVNELPDDFNNAINKLNDIVYGYRDYAIIGRK